MKQLVLDIYPAFRPTLDNFYVGANAAALAHLKLWLQPASPVRYGTLPTYLWGEVGSGKSHLLRAVWGALDEMGDCAGWLSPQAPADVEFDPQWRAVLLDDVDAFDAERQQTAFNWFVNAQASGCAVLAAGALPPADLPLRDDLRSRLGWGDVFALHMLDELQRRDVLRANASARGVHLSGDVVEFLLSRFSRDLGSLMELLNLIDRYALQTQRAVTIPMIKAMMDNA